MEGWAPEGGDARPTVAIFRSPVFHAHETFVRDHVASLSAFRPLVVGLEHRGHVPPEIADRLVLARPAERAALKAMGRTGGLARRLRPFAPVLVHAHFAPDGLLALPIAEALGVPLVTTLHGYDVSRGRAHLLGSGRLSWVRYGLLGGRLRRRGSLFLAVSEALRAKALAAGFPADRTITHYNGIDLDLFRPDMGAAEPDLVLHVGRLVEKKGTSVLLRAFAQIVRERPKARLVVIGEGPLRARLMAQGVALGISANTDFLGARPAVEVARWMTRAWLLAAPSVTAGDGDSEGLPTVVAEAAACGLPVVGSDHSGIEEAIEDGRTGFLVPEGQAEPLARRMSELLASRPLRTLMVPAARGLAERRFDRLRQAALLEAHYDRLLEQARAPATPGPAAVHNR